MFILRRLLVLIKEGFNFCLIEFNLRKQNYEKFRKCMRTSILFRL